MSRLFIHAAFIIIVAVLGHTASAMSAKDLSVEKFFGYPSVSRVEIAPDGKHLAFLAPMNGRIGIALQAVDSETADVLVRSASAHIDNFVWDGPRHVVYWGDVDGTEAYTTNSIDIETKRVRPYEGWLSLGRAIPENSADRRAIDAVATAIQRPRKEGRGVLRVVSDQQNVERLRISIRDEGFVYETRPGPNTEYAVALTAPADWFEQPVASLQFLKDGRTLIGIVTSAEHDRGALVKLDPATLKVVEVLYVPDRGEISSVVYSNETDRVLGVRVNTERDTAVWFDDHFQTVQNTLETILPDTVNIITNWSADRKRIVVSSYSDVVAPLYLLLDLTGSKPRLMPVGSSFPDLDAKLMARMEPIELTARDGLVLHGYLTKPQGEAGKVPLIMMPHWGPYGVRDHWGFNAQTQFLASRGYAVLQINFRGSGGYGREFMDKGRFELGAKMQDDKVDAVRWAIDMGIADPNRICWFGGSYGGYASLVAGVSSPELVTCIVNLSGPTDMRKYVRVGGQKHSAYIYSETWLGDRKRLAEISPIHHIEKLTAPSFHVYGRNDPRVDIEHWKALESRLKRQGKRYESIVNQDEGHNLENSENAIEVYKRIEEFLAKNL